MKQYRFSAMASGALFGLLMSAFSSQAMDKDMSQFIGDPVNGEKIFKKCSACHKIGDDAKNSIGPVLNNVYGRTAGTFVGYKYGTGLIEAGEGDFAWDAEKIFNYLKDPRKYIRSVTKNKKAKVKMTFKLKDEQNRKDVIAYVKSFSEN